jgi:hypothetical protein
MGTWLGTLHICTSLEGNGVKIQDLLVDIFVDRILWLLEVGHSDERLRVVLLVHAAWLADHMRE